MTTFVSKHITDLPQLPEDLDLSGTPLTAQALRCQEKSDGERCLVVSAQDCQAIERALVRLQAEKIGAFFQSMPSPVIQLDRDESVGFLSAQISRLQQENAKLRSAQDSKTLENDLARVREELEAAEQVCLRAHLFRMEYVNWCNNPSQYEGEIPAWREVMNLEAAEIKWRATKERFGGRDEV